MLTQPRLSLADLDDLLALAVAVRDDLPFGSTTRRAEAALGHLIERLAAHYPLVPMATAADLLGVSRPTLYEWVAKGVLHVDQVPVRSETPGATRPMLRGFEISLLRREIERVRRERAVGAAVLSHLVMTTAVRAPDGIVTKIRREVVAVRRGGRLG